jgi:starch synthase
MKFVDVVSKGDEFLEEELDKEFKKTKTEKFEYLDVDAINKIY